MDAKEIKSALKKVKEYLDAKDFKSAIKQCKVILKADRNNYLALVFFGAALQETEQSEEAPKAFKKAIEISPEQLLAWRGLASFYEKNENGKYQAELLNVYSNLIKLESDISKCSEIIKKYEKLAVSVGDSKSLNGLDLNEISNEEKQLLIKQCLVSIVLNLPLSDELSNAYSDLTSDVLSSKPLIDNHLDLSKKYLKFLYKQQKTSELVAEANKLRQIYPKELFPLEWICKVYTETPFEILKKELKDYSPKETYTTLLQLVPDSYLGVLCKGIHELATNDICTALDAFKQTVTLKPASGLAWSLLCQCQITLYQFSEAEYSARKALDCFEKSEKNHKNIQKCKIWLLQSLSEDSTEDKLTEAVKLGHEFYKNENDLKFLPQIVQAYIKLKNYDEVKNYLEILKLNDEYSLTVKYLTALIFKSQDNLTECQRELEKILEEHPNYFEALLELGKIYYETRNNLCLSTLLKSTKLNQWCYWNFLYLGHCYRHMIRDLDKARRCYQKAFQLNPKSAEAGMCLSDIYRNLKKEDLNLQLLSAATTQTYGSKWAWLRLGLHYLAINQLQDAVNSLRAAVRLDPNDKNSWESLGDAYLATGAYTSALKSYQRVNEIDDKLVYPLLQIATIKQLIGSYAESVDEFRIVLEKNPDYLPGLKGHAEACLSLVKYYISQNLNGLAGDLCQESVNSLVRCLMVRKDFVCIWKLLGDVCTQLSSLQDKYCCLKIAAWICGDGKNDENICLAREEILKLGIRSYCQAITLSPNTSSLWYDLAVSYNSLAKINGNVGERKEMLAMALSTVKKCVQLDDGNWEGWNLLGLICASEEIKNYPLAQHAFIKAITLNDTSAQAWTNLGTLYLCLGDLQLANQSFGEAQRCDHDYVPCWVGQALIAETLNHHDAMDLFRHSTQLGFHEEGSLGYANLVCKTLLETKNKTDRDYIYSIKNMNAVSVACDAMTWYTDRFTSDPCAFNMLGLLLERQNLYNSSFESFLKSLSLLENEENDVRDMILLNSGRIMLNLKKYEEALAFLKKIKKANFVNQCGLAFAYFKAGKYEDAYSSYETTLEWLAPDAGRSHILVAMATVVYMHQGLEDAKILLMQACQLQPPSVQGLFALCALGMLHSDLSLSELSLKELSKHEDDPKYLSHIAVFKAYIYLFKGKKDDAIRTLCKATHRHPDQPALWLSLCLLVLHLYPSCDSRVAARCAEVTMRTGRSSIDVSKVMSLAGLSNLLSGEGLQSLRSAQKAVHTFPYVTENWIVLIASVLSKCLARESVTEVLWLKKIITYVRRKLEASKPMTQWLSNNDRKVSLMADKLGYGCPVIEVEPSYFRIEDHENI